MKIDNSIKTANGLPIAEPQTSSAKTVGKAESSTATDKVAISSLASQQAGGVFDAEKVDAIKLAIAGGRFEVNTDKVADGLINTVKDLLHPAAA